MHPIIYDVAVSLDGFICGPQGDISKFDHEGPVVDDYKQRLAGYTTAIMGRVTYEYAFQYGLKIGENPYLPMRTFVFSQSLKIPEKSQIELLSSVSESALKQIQQLSDGPIYLCGGGEFAGSLLSAGLIDQVILKRAPVIYGGGTQLFGNCTNTLNLSRLSTKIYDNGYMLEEFFPKY